MLSMTLNLNMSSSLANIEKEAISRAWPEYLRGFPHCLCCCFSVGNVFPESNSKRSCDLVGDNLVAGSVCNKGHLLKDIGSLNLRREGARMGSKLLRLKKGLKVCLEWKVHLAYPASLQALNSNNSETNNANRT